VEGDLASGRLVRLDAAELSEPFAYYLVYPSEKGDRAAVKAFRAWLLNELGSANSQIERPLRASAAA
jgi:LysR family glycine cleavage system transcriptional activator